MTHNVIVGQQQHSIHFHQGLNLTALAQDWVHEHGVVDPSCQAFNKGQQCVVSLLAYEMELLALAMEVLTGVQGRYYDKLDPFYSGHPDLNPHISHLVGALPDSLPFHDQAQLIVQRLVDYLRRKTQQAHWIDAYYSLANLLYSEAHRALEHGANTTGMAYLEEAESLLLQSLGIEREHLTSFSNHQSGQGPLSGSSSGGDGGGKGGRRRALHCLAVSSHDKIELRLLQDSLSSAVGCRLEVLGLHEPWQGLGTKIRLLSGYLQGHGEVSDDDVLLFVDAYDVIALPNQASQDLVQLYQGLGLSIVFGAETRSAPDPALSLIYERLHSHGWGKGVKEHSRLRYVNSGTFIGSMEAIKTMVNEVLEDISQHHSTSKDVYPRIDDQRW